MVLRKGLLAQVGAEVVTTRDAGTHGGSGRSGAGARAGGLRYGGGDERYSRVGSGGGSIEVRESVAADEQDA